MPAYSEIFFNNLFLWTSTMQVPQFTGHFNSNTAFFNEKWSIMWYRTCKWQFWWQCRKFFAKNPNNSSFAKSNSDNISAKSSPFYVECSFTKNCRTISTQSPQAYFAIDLPWTRENQYWQVFRNNFAQKPKKIAHIGKKLTKMFLRARRTKTTLVSGWNTFSHKVLEKVV